MTEKNGQVQAPQPQPEEIVEITVAPIDVHLNSCGFEVADMPQGGKVIVFQHQTGVIRFTAALPEAAVAELISKLSGGITIARAMPVMQ